MRRGANSSTALVGGLGLPFFVGSASRIGVGMSSCEISTRGDRYGTKLVQRSVLEIPSMLQAASFPRSPKIGVF